MNILIMQTGKLGDMVCITPLFRAVKKKYPHSMLYVLGNVLNQELLAGNSHVDQYLVYPKKTGDIKKILKAKNTDVVILVSPNPAVLRAALFVRVKKIIVPKIVGGYSPYATKTYRLLSIFAVRVPIRFGAYMPREYLRLLEPLDIYANNTQKELSYTPRALERARTLLGMPRKTFLVGIAPGVGNKIKLWGGERFAEVATWLTKNYEVTIVILGGAGDREEVDRMRHNLSKYASVIDCSEGLSIDELKAVISQLALFISVDTGPLYIAEAVGIPTVDIVGPMDEHEQPPHGEKHRIVLPPAPRKPVLHVMNATVIDRREARRQVDAITPAIVIKEVEILLSKLGQKKIARQA